MGLKCINAKLIFITGKSFDGKETIIGFRLASYAAGSVAVAPIDHLCHIPDKMKLAVKVKFIINNLLLSIFAVYITGYCIFIIM